MKYRVSYEPEALNDLVELYDYIAERGEPVTAFRYIERIRTSCESLATFPYVAARWRTFEMAYGSSALSEEFRSRLL